MSIVFDDAKKQRVQLRRISVNHDIEMKRRVFPFKSQPKRAIASLDLARSRRELLSFEDSAGENELAIHVVQVETQNGNETISAAEGASYVDVLPQIGERAARRPGSLFAALVRL